MFSAQQLRAGLLLCAAAASRAVAAPPEALEKLYDQTVKPFLNKNCVGCHSGQNAAAQFDLKSYPNLESITRDYPRWQLVAERMHSQEMPPKPIPQPPAAAARQVIDWIHAVRAEEIRRTAGDPGFVPARRLSNAEYNYTIRDLTGEDLQVTKEFPVDPANPEGFDNSGESLTMSPALLNKYLQAARTVANHLVLTPNDFLFAPHPALVETDREKFAIQRIVQFYRRQPTDYAAYFEAAWRYQHRAALGKPQATLASVAAETGVSPKYLPMVWEILQEKPAVGPILKLQMMWRMVPAPKANQPDEVKLRCADMSLFVTRLRQHTAKQFAAPVVRGLPPGSQPLLNWKLKQFAEHRREADLSVLRNDNEPEPPLPAIPKYPGLHMEAAPRWRALSAHARHGDPNLAVPAAERKQYEAAFVRFANVFPDTFYITERGRYFPDDSQDKGRLLSAGYHSVLGFYRDDAPLVELILDEKGKQELDRLWHEFEFSADITARTWTQYFFNQSGEVLGRGAESASDRPVDHQITDQEVVLAMRDRYLAKAAEDKRNDADAPRAIREHYDGINATLRGLEKERAASEALHLETLARFAARAYRRPLTAAEREDLIAYYRTLRTKRELAHVDAVRESIVSILMSPDFLYRLDLVEESAAPAPAPTVRKAAAIATQPLTGYALASRLSYFLWSSMPDEELLAHAASGDLRQPAVLLAQAKRMLADPRARGFATEFTGNWLGFRHFETSNSVDRERFPTFTNDLREAMFEEPIRFFEDVARNDRPVLDLLYGRYTFANPALAAHYGLGDGKGNAGDWKRVDDADRAGRGGLLAMAVFLTQNSPGLRTSPVKRGNWVVQKVLGERIPAPPPSVPELPSDEGKSDLPVRDLLAKHREVPMCAACHARFDSFGLAFEGYGPVGNARTKDLAGRPVDTQVTYPGGSTGSALAGLQNYIHTHREKDFVRHLSRKLLAYALGRSLQLSDEAVVDSMTARLAGRQYHFQTLVETILTSPQFLSRRVPEAREAQPPVAQFRKTN